VQAALLTGSERALLRLERALAAAARCALFAAMAVLSIDAVGRYAFHAPLRWAHESLTLYLLPAIFFFGLATSIAARAHIAVDILAKRASPAAQLRFRLVANLLGIVLFGLILFVGADRLASVIRDNEVLPGVYVWPLWPSFAILVVGAATAALRSLLGLANDVAALRGDASARAAAVASGAHEVLE